MDADPETALDRATSVLNALGVTEPIETVVVSIDEPTAFTVGRRVHLGRTLGALREEALAFVVALEIAWLVLDRAASEDDARQLALALCARAGYDLGDTAPAVLATGRHRPPVLLAPPGCTATEMVVACARCPVRFPPGQPCPRCGGTELIDLRVPRARRRFLEQRMSPPTDGGLLALLGRIFRRAADDGATWGTLELRPLPAAPARTAGEVRTWGRVQVRRSLQSPVAGRRCAAWRLHGLGPSGVIDDAAVGAFDLLAEGGIVARVDAEGAFVDLGAAGPLELRHMEGAVAAVLRARGRVPDHASCALVETLLLDGSLVEVLGPASTEIATDGVRGAAEVLVYRDWPVIRLTGLQPVT